MSFKRESWRFSFHFTGSLREFFQKCIEYIGIMSVDSQIRTSGGRCGRGYFLSCRGGGGGGVWGVSPWKFFNHRQPFVASGGLWVFGANFAVVLGTNF